MDEETKKKIERLKGQQVVLDELLERFDALKIQAKAYSDLLPDDPADAFTIISYCIDIYAAKIGRKSSEIWDVMYVIAKQVHKEFGDYGEV